PIAVHAPGQPCRDEVDWFRDSVEHAARAGFVVLARVSLDIRLVPHSGSQFEFDYGVGSFGRQESGQRVFPPLPPPHTCTVFTARVNLRQIVGQTRSPAEWASIPQKTPGNRRLDAVPPFPPQPAKPLYLRAGAYTVSAPGGADIGPFSLKLDVPRAIEWKN